MLFRPSDETYAEWQPPGDIPAPSSPPEWPQTEPEQPVPGPSEVPPDAPEVPPSAPPEESAGEP
ncbi:MAG TPA: hypothetical protein VL131_04810 [Gammaproteobacteria bacterium]|nr:hypothetical protein [Gammaproteobacteria bacterium]